MHPEQNKENETQVTRRRHFKPKTELSQSTQIQRRYFERYNLSSVCVYIDKDLKHRFMQYTRTNNLSPSGLFEAFIRDIIK